VVLSKTGIDVFEAPQALQHSAALTSRTIDKANSEIISRRPVRILRGEVADTGRLPAFTIWNADGSPNAMLVSTAVPTVNPSTLAFNQVIRLAQ